jgi:REP element-mobilizing transposase RayT
MPYRNFAFRPGGIYHVYNRGASRQTIFPEAENYRYFLRLLEEHARRREIEIVCYCLMPNHFHLLLRQGGEKSVSHMMQGLCSAYTQALNRRLGRTGTLFEGRFKFSAITNRVSVLRTIRYIHQNPIKAHLVSHPEDWDGSDCRIWLTPIERHGHFVDELIRIHRFREVLGLPVAERYREILEGELPESPGLAGSSLAF